LLAKCTPPIIKHCKLLGNMTCPGILLLHKRCSSRNLPIYFMQCWRFFTAMCSQNEILSEHCTHSLLVTYFEHSSSTTERRGCTQKVAVALWRVLHLQKPTSFLLLHAYRCHTNPWPQSRAWLEKATRTCNTSSCQPLSHCKARKLGYVRTSSVSPAAAVCDWLWMATCVLD
jgi:hypothetical protein